jgi:hypothetical protein
LAPAHISIGGWLFKAVASVRRVKLTAESIDARPCYALYLLGRSDPTLPLKGLILVNAIWRLE